MRPSQRLWAEMKMASYFVEKLLFSVHDGRLGVGDQNEDVRVETKLVDPVIQICQKKVSQGRLVNPGCNRHN